jgi:ABC-type nitrate/sulfonate/bicarbonate transport system substrate-binding protein
MRPPAHIRDRQYSGGFRGGFMTLPTVPARCILACCLALAPIAIHSRAPQAGAGQAAAQAAPLGPNAPFTVAVSTATLEAAPVYIADEGPFGPRFQFINVRLLFTLTEGLYRIVAKRSAGIRTLADLKGHKVVVPRSTSAHYHLVAMLRSAGLQESDVTLVAAPATGMAAAVVKGEADAISMWEPESQNTVDALGSDAVIFQNNRIYREFFSVYSSTSVLNDPRRRAELVEFVRAIIASTGDLQREPARFFPLITRITKHPEPQIARSWEHHAFPLAVPADLLDIVTEEEKWVASTQQRAPRTRTEIEKFIDTSIITEARRPR